jgi:uncharacterized small protein (DUF1192 family)
MALQTVLETLDGVDDALKPFYAEAGEKFVLQIEGVDLHPDVANLKSAYERTKADRDAARAERDAAKALAQDFPDDFDLKKWEKLKDGRPDEAALVQLRQTLEAERDDWKGKYEQEQGRALKSALERDLTDALNAAGVVNPTYAKAARMILADGVKIGENGQPFVETDMGPLGIADHVKRWAAGEGKDFVRPPQGIDAKGGKDGQAKGENPWKPETRNLTRQAEILKTDPQSAALLRAAAGIT